MVAGTLAGSIMGGAAINAAVYTADTYISNGEFNVKEMFNTVRDGAADGALFAGAGLAVKGIGTFVGKNIGKAKGFLKDKSGYLKLPGSERTKSMGERVVQKNGSKSIDDLINGLEETINGKKVARNFEAFGGHEQTLKDFEALNPTNVKDIQTYMVLEK